MVSIRRCRELTAVVFPIATLFMTLVLAPMIVGVWLFVWDSQFSLD
jgi:hypothetical protein